MTITMPARVDAMVHWRSRHPRRVRTDWDVHGHPRHLSFIEGAALSREMDRL